MVLEEFGKPDVLRDIRIPARKPGDILVKVQVAGVCGTDVHQNLGDLSFTPPIPAIQGHETVGRIAELNGVTHDAVGQPLREGDRILWCHEWCGECYSCKILQQPFMCCRSRGYGFAPPEALRGGFAEYELVTAGTDVVRIPDSVDDLEALGVGCAFRSVVSNFEKLNDYGGIRTGDAVVVQGVGPIGLYSVVMAAQTGASQVIAVDMSEPRLKFAKKMGATSVISIKEVPEVADRVKLVKEMTNGLGAQVVVEASGFAPAFNEGMEYLALGGKYVVIGQSSARTIDFPPAKILEKYATIFGNKGADIRHFHKALKFIEAHKDKYPFGEVVSDLYPLEELNEALRVMREGTALKAAIDNRNR